MGVQATEGEDGTPLAAVRNFALRLSSDRLPLNDNQQFHEAIRAQAAGQIDYSLGKIRGTVDLGQWIVWFDDDSVGSLRTEGNVQTLELYNYFHAAWSTASIEDSQLQFSGSIVAIRVVPENSGLALGAFAGGLLLAAERKRRLRAARGA